MKKNRQTKMFTAALATTVAASGIVAVAPGMVKAETPSFSDVRDIPSHHFYEAVMKYTSAGMISGYSDGTFKPGQNITRQDAAKLLAMVLDLDMKNIVDPGFKDVSKTSPYYSYIAALVEEGIISGYEDNTFRPHESLTRAQMAKIIVLGFDLEETPSVRLPFSDINSKQWHIEFVRSLYAHEITTGTTPTTFSPNAFVTRGQMASFVFRSEAFVVPKVDEDQVAVDAAAGQLKAGAVTVSKGPMATDDTKLAAVQKYAASLITEKGVTVKAAQGKSAGSYIVTLTKGDATAERTIAITFDYAADDRFVTDVKAINAKQVEVKFATPVSKGSVLDSSNKVRNITFTMVSGATVNPGQLTGSLSEDGKTLTITAQWIFDGEYAVKTTEAIQATAGGKFEEYTAILKAKDDVAPKFVSGSATAKTSTNSFSLLFDEPVSASGVIAYVNDIAATVANDPSNPNRLNVTASKQVAAGTTATVTLRNVKDYRNNFASPNPVEASITISADTVAPTVKDVKVIGENRVEVTYDKEMNVASFRGKARLVQSNGTVMNLTATAGKDAKTVVLTGSGVVYRDSYSAVLFIDADVKDTVGNNAALYSTNVTMTRDITAPTFTTIEYKDGKIVAIFNEDIQMGGNNRITLIDQRSGEAREIILNYSNSLNATITNNTLTINQPLANGTYQLRLPANTVRDKAGIPNPNTIVNQSFVVENVTSFDGTRPVVSNVTKGSTNEAFNGEQVAIYTVTDTDSGVNLATVQDINNYTWDGKALPIGSYVTTAITGTADRATSVVVKVHVPSIEIQETKDALFTVNNIRDNAGNTIALPGTGNVYFVSGVQPEMTDARIGAFNTSLVLTFSKAVQGVDVTDFVITVNGVPLRNNSLEPITMSNTELNTYSTGIKASVGKYAQTYGNQDILYIEVDGVAGYSPNSDIFLEALHTTNQTALTDAFPVNLNASYITSLTVELTNYGSSPIRDSQGNLAVSKKLYVK
ncbi:S-layer homology domain-containing protein [Sporosarcina sp. ACRSL]|uniref:S-layer homology domain-containing protein n=1 Tax=Sporosarcina sp. ACRSL TaxID=2918215 RepID=UPI001EF453BA|nr:S-layer homology domain-containing protein [Sporosarcina sp. ACRSL]MCG7346458.1 S-layer homology domain-containing protein [Sporosarcina sp. ACRSL]